MAITVTVDDVRLIFETPMMDSQLQAFLDSAQRLVEEQLATVGLSDARLDDITKFMTAHLASTLTPSTLREKIGRDYDMWRTGEFKTGLSSTTYGQMVMTLDTTGRLTSAGQKKISFHVLQRPE